MSEPQTDSLDNSMPEGSTDILLSVTNRKGIISATNRTFSEIAEFPWHSLTGKPQNIVRHMDMPKLIFELMWKTINSNIPFGGYIKNKTKTGKSIWLYSLIFPLEKSFFSVSIRAQSPIIESIDALYSKIKSIETQNRLEAEQEYNNWLVNKGFNDYSSWLSFGLQQEMQFHPFFSTILIENEFILDLNPKIDKTLQSISAQAVQQMWDAYVDFQHNFKNGIIRLRECIILLNRFQSQMMTLNQNELIQNIFPLAYSKEFTTDSIHRMYSDFFMQATRKLQFWCNSLILQSKVIDDIIVDAIKNLASTDKSQIHDMFETLDLINILTENIAQLPEAFTTEYERVHQKTEAYLKLIHIENKPEVLNAPGNEMKKECIQSIHSTAEKLFRVYSDLCNDFEVDIQDFHKVARSAFHIMLGPKRASG